jgi:hypothetical protein
VPDTRWAAAKETLRGILVLFGTTRFPTKFHTLKQLHSVPTRPVVTIIRRRQSIPYQGIAASEEPGCRKVIAAAVSEIG